MRRNLQPAGDQAALQRGPEGTSIAAQLKPKEHARAKVVRVNRVLDPELVHVGVSKGLVTEASSS